MARDLKQRTTGGAVQQKNEQPATLAQQLTKMTDEFQRAMPQGMEATQLVRDAQTALRQNPKLARVTPASFFGGLMTCAQLGLRPGVLGQAYLIPYGQQAQLVLGYQGLLELIYRSGLVETIVARAVYENDEFLLEYGLSSDTLVHRPPAGFKPRGKAVAYYAIARMKNGGYQITDPVGLADMQSFARKHANGGGRSGPWKEHFDEMAKKTMIRQLAKMLPKSPEVMRAITHDGAVRTDHTADSIDETPTYIDGELDDDPAVQDDPPQDSTPVQEPVDSPPPVDDTADPRTPQTEVAEKLAELGVTDPENIAGWLQQALGDPDAPQVPADLNDAEASQVLEAIAASKK
ncbi:RecT-like DNA pairing protein [Gordonia phage Tardus]|uniref:RecT-like DNA pairing protein n=1 Tax=Gordonia phage Tardus TaxID=2939734 RepID=A0A9E7E4X5_9CAUD|nr:RecT-like DNA pairing protein [Gordonia phage Tardus]